MALELNTSVAPEYLNRWSERLKIFLENLSSMKHQVVADTTELPDPRRWYTKQIWVTDIGTGSGRFVFSDGANWIRTDTGATV